MSDWRSDVCSSDLACEGRGGLGRGAFWISPNRGHPLPASPCRRRGRGQGKSSRLKPLLQVPGPPTPGGYSFFIACPPNSLRIADSSLRSEEHTSELQSLMRISYAVFCLKKKKNKQRIN